MDNIAFVLPTTLGDSGGVKMCFEYASEINKLENVKCDIIYPIIPSNYKKWKFKSLNQFVKFVGTIIFNLFNYNFKKVHNKYKSVDIKRIYSLKKIKEMNYDTLIGTSWETIPYIKETIDNKKIYFVQSYETWAGPSNYIKETYNNEEFLFLVVSNFIKDILKKVHNQDSELVYNPIKTNVDIKNMEEIDFKETKYGVIYRKQNCKNFNLIIEFLNKHPEFQDKFICIGKNIPKKITKYFNEIMDGSDFDNMKKFYKKINTFILPSNIEGFGLTILEAMCYGNVIFSKNHGIIYDIGLSNSNYINLNKNEIINNNFDGNFEKIKLSELEKKINLYEEMDKKKRYNIAMNAAKTVKNYIDKFEIKNNIKYFINN